MPLRTPALLAALLLAACTPAASVTSAGDRMPGDRMPAAAAPVANRAPVTILVSIDGFRPDYLDRGITPRLSALAADGVRAAMRPSFPSKTFPNHYAIVTGLVPDHNGIVANRMEDARRPGEVFTMQSDDPFWWNEAEPIWVSAEKAGIRTATMFWPGSNVAVGGTRGGEWPNEITGGTRPTDWMQFNQAIPEARRVEAILDWARRPAATRPRLMTLYFDSVDTAGHAEGPDGAGTRAAIVAVDALFGRLVDGLAELGVAANIVVVADHGMAETSHTRVIPLSALADPADARVVENGPYLALAAVPGREAALEARLLRPHDHAACWRKGEIPARLRYGTNPRVPPYLCLAEPGWLILDKPPRTPTFTGGQHGYDNATPDMAALFLANGPAFARGRTIAPFDNVSVTALLRDLIGLPPAARRDGDDAPFRDVVNTAALPRPSTGATVRP